MLFNLTLESVIWRVHINQDGLKLNGTHQLLVCADDVNIFGGSVSTIKKNTKALLLASKESRLEESVDISKYMVLPRDQGAGRSRNIKIDDKPFESLE